MEFSIPTEGDMTRLGEAFGMAVNAELEALIHQGVLTVGLVGEPCLGKTCLVQGALQALWKDQNKTIQTASGHRLLVDQIVKSPPFQLRVMDLKSPDGEREYFICGYRSQPGVDFVENYDQMQTGCAGKTPRLDVASMGIVKFEFEGHIYEPQNSGARRVEMSSDLKPALHGAIEARIKHAVPNLVR